MLGLKVLLVTLTSCAFFESSFAQSSERSVAIQVWPLESTQPQQLAQVTYNPSTLTSTVSALSPPQGPYQSENLVRVGLYDSKTSDWRGIVTSAASFDTKYQQKISLHLDDDGSVWHVGFSAYPKPKSIVQNANMKIDTITDASQVVVEIIKPSAGPTPVLNKPVVLTAEGKVQEKEPEKGMLQKYVFCS